MLLHTLIAEWSGHLGCVCMAVDHNVNVHVNGSHNNAATGLFVIGVKIIPDTIVNLIIKVLWEIVEYTRVFLVVLMFVLRGLLSFIY